MNLFKHAQEIVMAEETTKLFLGRSINEVTIKDIANHIGVGEATIYRHYKTKFNMVLVKPPFTATIKPNLISS